MRKILWTMVCFAGLLGATSCEKDYVCSCSFVSAYDSSDTTPVYVYFDISRKSAEESCEAKLNEFMLLDSSATCTLE